MSILGQRALFYTTDSKPECSRNQAPPVPQRRFGSQDCSRVRLQFDDPHLTALPGEQQSWPEVIGRDQSGRIKVGLDFDSTCMAVYGKQEGADRGRHPRKKEKPGFQPKFAVLSGLDVMVHQRLYPESRGLNSGFSELYREAKDRLPRRSALEWVRGDGGLYSNQNVRMLQSQGLIFGISAMKTSHMWRAIDRLPAESWQRFEDQHGRPVELAELYYKPASWPAPMRVFILSRRLRKTSQTRLWQQEEYDIYAYLTNYEGSLWERYKFCVGRCTVEKCIRESKLGFDWHHLPCGQWDAVRWSAAGRTIRPDTIRRQILAVPGRFGPVNCEILHLPAWWPHRHHIRHAQRERSDLKN